MRRLWSNGILLPVEWYRDARYVLWDRWEGRQRIATGIGAAFVAVIVGIGHVAYTATAQRITAEQRRIDVQCLAENIYHEARGEPRLGQVAVAEVTMNRVASPRFPDSVCRVVHQKSAFSWTLDDTARPNGPAWRRAVEVAASVYDGVHAPVVPGALHYHARGIEPAWARAHPPLRTIGRHIFYP
ncbi:MAG: cell wall hydrolase [Halofilum sp. (in: g-proteobacteria)]|nr:cell wall hydrolase [Halofilum sp. (in: g-proteobacteria)]